MSELILNDPEQCFSKAAYYETIAFEYKEDQDLGNYAAWMRLANKWFDRAIELLAVR